MNVSTPLRSSVQHKNGFGSFILLLLTNLVCFPISAFPFYILATNEHLEMEAIFYMLLGYVTVPLGIFLSITLYNHVAKIFQRELLNQVLVIGFSSVFGCLALLQPIILQSPQSRDREKDYASFTTPPVVTNEELRKDLSSDNSLEYLYNYTIQFSNPTKHTYLSSLIVEIKLLNPNGIGWNLTTHRENPVLLEPGITSLPIEDHIYMDGQDQRLYDVIKANMLVNPKVEIHIKLSIDQLGFYKDYSIPSSFNWLQLTSDPEVILRSHQPRNYPSK